jgi:RNA polymerase sigma factor (sigma-70 family)
MRRPKTTPPTNDRDLPVLISTSADPCESALWSSLRSGKRQALDVIFESHVRLLYAYGKNITCDEALVSDCVQDVFTELWIRRESLAPEVNSIRHYLFKSLRRRISRRLSADKRIALELAPDDDRCEVEVNVEDNIIMDQTLKEKSAKLTNSLAALNKRQREVIYLKFYVNMTCEEIASVMKTDVKAVYNLLARSMQSLREFFNVHPIEY